MSTMSNATYEMMLGMSPENFNKFMAHGDSPQFSEVAEEMHANAAEAEERMAWQDEVAASVPDPEPEDLDHRGWPGDGSGEDDLADYNANEADDYAHEGMDDREDSYLDASYEDRTEMEYGDY